MSASVLHPIQLLFPFVYWHGICHKAFIGIAAGPPDTQHSGDCAHHACRATVRCWKEGVDLGTNGDQWVQIVV